MMDLTVQRKLEDVEFVESVTSNVETQNALLESLESDNRQGRFSTAEEMFAHMQKEWLEEENN